MKAEEFVDAFQGTVDNVRKNNPEMNESEAAVVATLAYLAGCVEAGRLPGIAPPKKDGH